MISLSKRLRKIAECVPLGSKVGDIGTDHAMLPIYLLQLGKIDYAVAGELNDGPYQTACQQIAAFGLQEQISVRQGNGLEVIQPGEVDVVTIAGMGGQLMVQILTEGYDRLEGVHTLVLQPNVGEGQVRRFLFEHQWFLRQEYILQEDGVIYEVLVAIRTETAKRLNDILYNKRFIAGCSASMKWKLAMGPYLLERAEPVWFAKWRDEQSKLRRIDEQLAHSSQNEAMERRKMVQQEIQEMEALLTCLQKARRSSSFLSS